MLVDRARDQLLAGAGLAEDEDGGICWGDLRDLCEHLAERRRGADDLFEHRGAVDILAQRQILITHALFGPLAIIDVGARRVPAQRLTMLIPYRVVLHEEPPILPVVAPSALLEVEGHAARESLPALLPQACHVFRMKNARAEIGRGHLRDRESGVLEQGPVAVEGLPIRTQDGNRLGNGVDNLLRLLLRRPESFHSSNATPRLPDRNVGFAAVRFHLPPVRFRLAAARFHLRPVRPELSDISLPLAGARVRLLTARARVPTVSLPLAGVRRRLPPARASVPTVSRPLAGVRGRLPPARARVPTVRRPLAGVRDCLPPARASVPTVSRPLLAMRGLHPAYDGTGHDHVPTALERAGAPPDDVSSSLDERRVVPGKRPFARAGFRPRARTKSSPRDLVPLRDVLARLSHRASRVGRRQCAAARGPTPCRATEGGSYERNIAQAARKGRAGPRFHPGPPDGRGW